MSDEPDKVVLLVTFTLEGGLNTTLYESEVSIPASLQPSEIVPAIKQSVRPYKKSDPSDNYRGQNPSQVTIINIVNLSKLL